MIINYVTTILIILRAPSIILFTLWITSSTVSRLFLIVRLNSINNMVLCIGMYGCLAIKITCLCNVFLPKIMKVCISPHKYDSLDWKRISKWCLKSVYVTTEVEASTSIKFLIEVLDILIEILVLSLKILGLSKICDNHIS